MEIIRQYPNIASLERRTHRRIPRFVWDYFVGGVGPELCIARNRDALDGVILKPQYLCNAGSPDLSSSIAGQIFDLPFGVAPVGLGGLIWPRSAQILAGAARRHNMPFALSAFSNVSLETIADIAPEQSWFQHYVTNRPEIEKDLMDRLVSAGYRTILVTIDIPTAAKRDRDIKNGLSDPVSFNLRQLLQSIGKPRWALETAREGVPAFVNLARYCRKDATLAELTAFFGSIIEGHVTPERLKVIRDAWPGKLVVKGVLHSADAEECRRIGADALVVSNHGGRQLDAAPAATDVMAEVRSAAGREMSIIADGGVRSGLDVARMLACGADLVLLGRAFLFGVAALGPRGGDYVISILREELRTTMAQIGCNRVRDLPRFLGA